MKLRKMVTIALMFAVTCTIGIFANGKKEASSADEPLTVSMFYADNASYPLQDDWLVLKEIEKASGVNLDLVVVPDADVDTKLPIIFASGDVPEIITKYTATVDEVNNGLLLPINKYLDKMPNYKKFTESNGYAKTIENLTMNDGNYYTMPGKADEISFVIHSWMVRKDLFEKNNIAIPTTLDEVTVAAEKLKKLYPDSYPVINRFGEGNFLQVLGYGFGVPAGWALGADGYGYDADTDSFFYVPTSDKFKALLTYVHDWYEKGILDPEFATLDSSAYEQRASQGETFIFLDWVGNQTRYNLVGKTVDPDFDVEPIMPPKGPYGDYAAQPAVMYEQGFALSSSIADDPRCDEILAFIDWFYSDEAAIITTFGVKDVTYTESNGNLEFIDPDNPYWSTDGLLNNSLNIRRHPDWFRASNGDEIAELYSQMAKLGVNKDPDPSIRYTEEENDELQLMTPSLNDYFGTQYLKFIFGEKSLDTDWDAFVKECKAKGSEKIGEIVNAAYDRQK